METNKSDEQQKSELREIRHGINNALTGVIGHAQLLLMRGQLNEKSRERVEKIEELANRIRETVARIKD